MSMVGVPMVKIAICEDNLEVSKQINQMLTECYGPEVTVTEYVEAADMLDEWEKKGTALQDIILTDICFHDEDGISVASKLQQRFRRTAVIFMTGYPECADRIFEAEPSYLLVKPISREKLKMAVDRAMEKIRLLEIPIILPVKGGVLRLLPSEISHVESKLRQAEVHTQQQTWLIPLKMDEMEELLPENFLRVHQSYLVNMDHIKHFIGKEILLFSDVKIPSSRSHYQLAKKMFMDYLASGGNSERK